MRKRDPTVAPEVRLSTKQQAFIEAMAKPGITKGAAAKAAGYSPRTASAQATKMLGNPVIVEAIAKQRSKVFELAAVTESKVVKAVASTAFATMADAMGEDGSWLPTSEWPKRFKDAIQSVKIGRRVIESEDGRTVEHEEVIDVRLAQRAPERAMLMRYLELFNPDRDRGVMDQAENALLEPEDRNQWARMVQTALIEAAR